MRLQCVSGREFYSTERNHQKFDTHGLGGQEVVQTDRQKLLEEAAEKGAIQDYSAWRVSLKGRRFEIRDATLFNIQSPSGNPPSTP